MWWACNPGEEEQTRGPTPRLLDEEGVEIVGFAGKVVGAGEGVRSVCEGGIGGVEVGVVDDRVDCSEDDDGSEDRQREFSGIRHSLSRRSR